MKVKGIYEIVNNITNKRYIGSCGRSFFIQGRIKEHIEKLESKDDEHHCAFLQHEWNQYGKDNFSFNVIEEISEKDTSVLRKRLVQREQFWINHYGKKNLYNDTFTAINNLGIGKDFFKKPSHNEIKSYKNLIDISYLKKISDKKLKKKNIALDEDFPILITNDYRFIISNGTERLVFCERFKEFYFAIEKSDATKEYNEPRPASLRILFIHYSDIMNISETGMICASKDKYYRFSEIQYLKGNLKKAKLIAFIEIEDMKKILYKDFCKKKTIYKVISSCLVKTNTFSYKEKLRGYHCLKNQIFNDYLAIFDSDIDKLTNSNKEIEYQRIINRINRKLKNMETVDKSLKQQLEFVKTVDYMGNFKFAIEVVNEIRKEYVQNKSLTEDDIESLIIAKNVLRHPWKFSLKNNKQ